MGYLNKELDTKEVLSEDEWLSLGHLGHFDKDDFLTVHGKPESFITLTTGEVVIPHKVSKRTSTVSFFLNSWHTEKSETFMLSLPVISVFFQIEQLVRMELPCVRHAMLVGDQEQYLAVLLVLDTLLDQATQMPGKELTEDAQRWFRHARSGG